MEFYGIFLQSCKFPVNSTWHSRKNRVEGTNYDGGGALLKMLQRKQSRSSADHPKISTSGLFGVSSKYFLIASVVIIYFYRHVNVSWSKLCFQPRIFVCDTTASHPIIFTAQIRNLREGIVFSHVRPYVHWSYIIEPDKYVTYRLLYLPIFLPIQFQWILWSFGNGRLDLGYHCGMHPLSW